MGFSRCSLKISSSKTDTFLVIGFVKCLFGSKEWDLRRALEQLDANLVCEEEGDEGDAYLISFMKEWGVGNRGVNLFLF